MSNTNAFNMAGKSILFEEAPYLLELVRYIHLNAIGTGIIKELGGIF